MVSFTVIADFLSYKAIAVPGNFVIEKQKEAEQYLPNPGIIRRLSSLLKSLNISVFHNIKTDNNVTQYTHCKMCPPDFSKGVSRILFEGT